MNTNIPFKLSQSLLLFACLSSTLDASVHSTADCPTPDAIRGNNVAMHMPRYQIYSLSHSADVGLFQSFVPLTNAKDKSQPWDLFLVFNIPIEQLEDWGRIKRKAQSLYNNFQAPAQTRRLKDWRKACLYNIGPEEVLLAVPSTIA